MSRPIFVHFLGESDNEDQRLPTNSKVIIETARLLLNYYENLFFIYEPAQIQPLYSN